MSTPLSNPAMTLIANLGSFWSQTYSRDDQLKSIVNAGLSVHDQTMLDMAAAIAAVSRFDIPVFKREIWKHLIVDQATVERANKIPYEYGEPIVYNGEIVYGQTRFSGNWRIPLPANVVNIESIVNRPVSPSVVWTKGAEFTIKDGYIECEQDPFTAGFVVNLDQDDNKQLSLWLYNSDLDLKYVYNQFGFVVGLYAEQSSENYKNLVNAVFDTLIKGSNALSFRTAIASLFALPVVIEPQETVTEIDSSGDALLIVTDHHIYNYPLASTPNVSVGDKVYAGDILTTDIQIFEGDDLLTADISALALAPYNFGIKLRGSLVFDNEVHPTTYSVNSDGFVNVTFPIGGDPLDVEAFWEHVVAVTSQPNQVSVAQALRTNSSTGQPQLQEVASEVNPMEFIIDNVLKDNLVIVNLSVYNSELLANAKNLLFVRKLLPAHIALMFNIEVLLDDEEYTGVSDNYDLSDNQWPTAVGFFYQPDHASFNADESYNGTITEFVEIVRIS